MDALEIRDRESLERWLDDKPAEWAQLIALRAALRVFPLVLPVGSNELAGVRDRFQALTLAVWRCLLISSVSRKYPSEERRHTAADYSRDAFAASEAIAASASASAPATKSATKSAAASAAASAASTSARVYTPAYAAAAASAVAGAADTNLDSIWPAITADIQWLETNGEDLEHQPLWLEDVRGDEKYHANFPLWARKPFDAFAESELARTTSWGLIVDWYRALLPNNMDAVPRNLFEEKVEIEIAKKPMSFGNLEDPQAVMDDIARLPRWQPPKTPVKQDEATGDDHGRFSIIRTAQDNYWEGKTIFQYDRSRFLESGYTNSFFREEFFGLDATAIEKLKRLPTLFTYEHGTDGSSRIGRLIEVNASSSKIDFKVKFDESFRDIQADEINSLLDKASIITKRFEPYRTQWAIKEGDLYEILNNFRIDRRDSQVSADDKIEKFIFLSHARSDRTRATAVRQLLIDEGITVWWDDDIAGGDGWRDRIAESLEASAAVLTLWSAESVSRDAVREEAARAQTDRKLVHAKLDEVELPYGFGETHYIDLRTWDGTATHESWRKLVQSLWDKLHPPSLEEMRQRLAASSPIAMVAKDGMLSPRDTPPNARPTIINAPDLEQRLAGIRLSYQAIRPRIDSGQYQVPQDLVYSLDFVAVAINAEPLTWYGVEDSCHSLCDCMADHDASGSWNTTLVRDLERLARRMRDLQPLLQPEQVPATEPGAKPPEPEPLVRQREVAEVESIAEEFREILSSDEAQAVLSENTVALGDAGAVQVEDAQSIMDPDKQLPVVRRGLKRMAYVVGGILSAIGGGVVINLLTAPEAAATLAARLKPLYDLMIGFF